MRPLTLFTKLIKFRVWLTASSSIFCSEFYPFSESLHPVEEGEFLLTFVKNRGISAPVKVCVYNVVLIFMLWQIDYSSPELLVPINPIFLLLFQ